MVACFFFPFFHGSFSPRTGLTFFFLDETQEQGWAWVCFLLCARRNWDWGCFLPLVFAWLGGSRRFRNYSLFPFSKKELRMQRQCDLLSRPPSLLRQEQCVCLRTFSWILERHRAPAARSAAPSPEQKPPELRAPGVAAARPPAAAVAGAASAEMVALAEAEAEAGEAGRPAAP